MSGTWKFHDGTHYTGTFSGDQPSGSGLFAFPTGNQQSGSYDAKGIWTGDAITCV